MDATDTGNGLAVIEHRDASGRFLPGNPGGPGSPHVAALAAWRGAFREAVTPARLAVIIENLLQAAERGEQWAIVETLTRTLGKPKPPDDDGHDGRLDVVVRYVTKAMPESQWNDV